MNKPMFRPAVRRFRPAPSWHDQLVLQAVGTVMFVFMGAALHALLP